MLRLSALPSAAVLLALAAPLACSQSAPATRITVDVRATAGKVNPWVFGGNMISYQRGGYGDASPMGTDRGEGVWDPDKRRSVPEMVNLERAAGLSVARWPGGCATHLYQWKRSIGPIASRPNQRFGLPEFLRHCKDIGAEPLITVAEYYGTAKDAAQLVEYLNAPNDGKHPWAAKRAADGHPAPWRVTWFEYGNESEHGPHASNEDAGKRAPFTATEYARNYLAYRHAMKAVDPHIKLGAVVATGFPDLNGWAKTVTRIAGRQMDFAIHHSYKVSYGGNDEKIDAKAMFAAGLACAPQIQDYYDQMRRLFREQAKRDDIPIAVTEYNGAFVQEKPVPYRHTLGNALINAEMLRVFLNPKNRIVMANFWEFANEYWGAVKGWAPGGEPLVKRPQYYPFALYHQHFGTERVNANVACPTYDTEGGFGIQPASGKGSVERVGKEVAVTEPWTIGEVKGAAQKAEGDTLAVEFQDAGDLNYYHANKSVPAKPNTWYRISGWVKTEALTTGNGACYQVGDSRGWLETQSAAITPSVSGTKGWTQVTVDYRTLPETRALSLTARRLGGAGAVSGRAWYRGLTVHELTPHHYAAIPWLGVDASRIKGAGGRTKACLMVVNRRQDGPVTTAITVRGMTPGRARAWVLSGPAVDSTNEQNPDAVTVHALDLGTVRNGFTIELPAHSLTAIEVDAAGR